MTVVDVYNLEREKISEVELQDAVFDVPIKPHVMHQVVTSQLAGKRAGTASAKGRSDVAGSGAKLWRQKGTGRARVGNAASPTRRGGGAAFGPSPRTYTQRVSKKIRKAALRMALTDKVQNEQLIVVESFDLPLVKTKDFVGVMNRFEVRKALIVTGDTQENLDKSSKNVPWVKVMRYQGLNVYDILKYDQLFLERSAIEKIQEALVV